MKRHVIPVVYSNNVIKQCDKADQYEIL